jgi:pyruvate,water dikinase
LDLETRVLGAWRTPIVNDFFAMIFFGVLSRLSQRWIDADGTLHNDLLTGEGNMESIEPVRRARVLAHQIHESAHLQSVFELAPEAVLEQLKTQPELAEFRRQLDDYLRLYGDRCMNELKLEEPNLRDDPLPLIRIIGSLAKNPVELADKSPRRAQAEARISRMSVLKRVVFRWVLDNARQYIRNRENLRFARSRLFGMLRRIFHALGDQWAENQVLERTDDIFYLSVHEIWDFVAGTAVTQNLKGLVALRRAEYGDFKSAGAPLPDRFETFGIPYLDLPRDTMPHPPSDSSILQGMGCCSGQVRGRAQVVKSANEVSHLGGDILVAERTDPGWIFLYPSASGILVERGSPLSHSVIVARELGKPIVVNIPNLTARVKTGAEVELDGGRGTVRLFES